jgi:hypothetical protein
MSATELVCAATAATPSQQQLRRSSVAAALQPSTQLVVFVASLLEVLRRLEGGRDLRAAYKLRRKSISSVAAAEAGDGNVPRP